MIIAYMVAGVFLFLAGYITRHFLYPKTEQVTSISKPRIKTSLRNPLKTYAVEFDRFKSRESNLYEPTSPKRKN